jgi:hypothetical protein
MRQVFLILLVLIAANGVPANATENVLRRPSNHLLLRRALPDKASSSKVTLPITPKAVRDAVNARIRSLFVRAADPLTGLVTVASAEKAGLGYFTGHFAEIDSNSDGNLTYDEVRVFLKRQSPIKGQTANTGPVDNGIRIIE